MPSYYEHRNPIVKYNTTSVTMSHLSWMFNRGTRLIRGYRTGFTVTSSRSTTQIIEQNIRKEWRSCALKIRGILLFKSRLIPISACVWNFFPPWNVYRVRMKNKIAPQWLQKRIFQFIHFLHERYLHRTG